MKAIILAAGKSTRLLPLTKETPQCLLKINDKTMLGKQIELLKKGGIQDIIVITGHLSNLVEEYCKKNELKYTFNPFYAVSGMALTLWVAKEELNDDLLLLYSDILFDSEIIKGLIKSEGEITLAIKKNGLREEAEKVIEEEGEIKNVSKTSTDEENGEFIGITKISKIGAQKLIKNIYQTAKINIQSSLIDQFNELISKGIKIKAYEIKESAFIDVDFPKDLNKAKDLIFN